MLTEDLQGSVAMVTATGRLRLLDIVFKEEEMKDGGEIVVTW